MSMGTTFMQTVNDNLWTFHVTLEINVIDI